MPFYHCGRYAVHVEAGRSSGKLLVHCGLAREYRAPTREECEEAVERGVVANLRAQVDRAREIEAAR